VAGAARLDRIHRRAHRAVADRVDVQVETGEMHTPHLLEYDLTLVLQLAARDRALAGVVAVRPGECIDVRGRQIPPGVRPHVTAQLGGGVDIAGDRRVP